MALGKLAALFFVFVLLLYGGNLVVQESLITAGEDFTVGNETWTPDAGNVTTLNDSNLDNAYYEGSVTVRDENDTEAEDGTDYEWFANNGTVKALNNGSLDGDANATITYEYQQTTDEQEELAALFATLTNGMQVFIPVLGVVLFVVLLRGF